MTPAHGPNGTQRTTPQAATIHVPGATGRGYGPRAGGPRGKDIATMAKQRVKFTFPQELITLPIIYELGKQYNIVTNVRRADVTEDRGWVVLEMDGPIEEIERALAWVAAKGVRVDPVQGDIVEG